MSLPIEIVRAGDPLGSGVGGARRLLFEKNHVLRAPATALLQDAQAALAVPERPDTAIWRTLFDAIDANSSPSPVLEAATGLTGPSAFGASYAVLAATRSGDLTAVHWALAVADPGSCASLPHGLKGQIKAMADPAHGVTTSSGGQACYAVFSMAYGANTPRGAMDVYRRTSGYYSAPASPR